ncbi:beta-ribofuranosylaminobenzene 5'-phosphate synthase [Methylophaga frappieri]|uniref:Beta-ribofuranosylaminobenzene 5'-phosphate synthase n=1 Tax=Methylophaga frappieri (strain ATCC BAA-2434 / DSM 25690 / JAM7) TaxID=754477 RepID=I1YK94_METFJ|nr:beta-ribofuranosylaminobenzene 5'-phosphate synthase [Methylophaga frappieri]
MTAPARLHLGFLDLGANLGRRYGSIGMAIDSHRVRLQVHPGDHLQITGQANEAIGLKVQTLAEQIIARLQQHRPGQSISPHIQLQEMIPEHAGLGSGTQLAISLGHALAAFYGVTLNSSQIAQLTGRGKRSGIGINTFERGGFVVDGGLADSSDVPPLLMHHAFPESWRILLIMDPHYQGVHGQAEKKAFTTLPRFSATDSQAICHLTLMQLLPALVEANIDAFGAAITDIQSLIGEYFAPAQGGQFTSPRVAQLLHLARNMGHRGIAQSSWGPTGCVFVDSPEAATTLKAALEAQCQQTEMRGLQFHVTAATQKPAQIIRDCPETPFTQLRSHHG